MKILKFYADWCKPCKELTTIIGNIKTKLNIESIDIDDPNKQDLVEKFNICSLPTLVFIDKESKELERIVGTIVKDKLQSTINKYEQL